MNMLTGKSLQTCAEHFIEVNRNYWCKQTNVLDGERWIYVLHALHRDFTIVTLEDVVAKGLQEKEALPIVSITSGRADELVDVAERIDASFQIEQTLHPSYYDYDNEEIQSLARKWAAETYGKKDDLIQLTYRGVKFGNVIYDDMIRRGNSGKRGEVFDCFDISQDKYYKFIRNALAIIDQAYEIFAERKPAYLITREPVYTKSLYIHVANIMGAKIIVPLSETPDIMVQVAPNKHLFADITIADLIRAQREKCLQRCHTIDTDLENYFLMQPKNEKIACSLNQIGIAGGKKNVFILPHAFGDASRIAARHNVYRDYCEWFLDTIRIIKDIPNVNWIVKDHPWTLFYKQENFVRSIFEKNKTENMYWVDKELNGMKIKDIADCVLTCTGDAGIEYWAYGIPTITTGDAYYCSWGISYQMKSLEEYENTLKNIDKIAKPSAQSVTLARKYLMAYKNTAQNSDAFSKIFCNFYLKGMSISATNGIYYGDDVETDRKYGEIIYDFYESLVSLLKENDWKSSDIYQLNNMCYI